jgi:hypothetical protein
MWIMSISPLFFEIFNFLIPSIIQDIRLLQHDSWGGTPFSISLEVSASIHSLNLLQIVGVKAHGLLMDRNQP